MAESSGSRNPRERAVSLLRVVQNLLERSNEDSDPSASNEPNTDSTQQNNSSSIGQGVMQNFRSLLAGYNSSRNQSRSSLFAPPAKRQKSALYVPKETWTHEFFCMADRLADSAPSRSEKLELQLCGLGRKKIVFGAKDNAVKVKEKLEQAYPKLVTGGGFEIFEKWCFDFRAWFVCLEASSDDWIWCKFFKKRIWPGLSACLHTPPAEKFRHFTRC